MTRRRTRITRAGVGTDPAHRAVMPPIYLTTTYAYDGFDGKGAYDYSRTGNPTRDEAADAIADLEGGAGAVMTSSGLAAVNLCLHLLGSEDTIVAPHDCYGGTHRMLHHLAAKGHFKLRFLDFSDARAVKDALDAGPRMILVETPSNPLMRLIDIAAVAKHAHQNTDTLVVADNTFLSPVLQQPLTLGADIVVHSTTKFLNGHSDVVGGVAVAKDKETAETLAWWANCLGVTGAPFDAYQTLRGLRTLPVRVAEQQRTTGTLLDMIGSHEAVATVHYPGLPTHPGHAIAKAQQDGFGSVFSLELRGGLAAVKAFADGLEHISFAQSLGGVESLACHPASMTHRGMDPVARSAAGIGDGLIRLSIGLEDPEDLLIDLAAALDRAARVGA